jgi:hypothetical protein
MQSTTKEKSVKKLRRIQRGMERHWVDDGFPVRTLFAYSDQGAELSPFLLSASESRVIQSLIYL